MEPQSDEYEMDEKPAEVLRDRNKFDNLPPKKQRWYLETMPGSGVWVSDAISWTKPVLRRTAKRRNSLPLSDVIAFLTRIAGFGSRGLLRTWSPSLIHRTPAMLPAFLYPGLCYPNL
jgi:hypothetical protein